MTFQLTKFNIKMLNMHKTQTKPPNRTQCTLHLPFLITKVNYKQLTERDLNFDSQTQIYLQNVS